MRLHVVDDSGVYNHLSVVARVGGVVMGRIHRSRVMNGWIKRQIAVPTSDHTISTQAAPNGASLMADAVPAATAEGFPRF
jgi:hypothetical protein